MAKGASVRNKINREIETGSLSEQIALWGLLGLLFLVPFFRGLFFPEDQRVVLACISLVFWLAVFAEYQKQKLEFFSSHLEYLALGMPLIYIISIFTAANYALTIDEVVKYLIYFMVFWSVLRFARSETKIKTILAVIYFSALGVSLAGLFNASGWIEIKDGFLPSDGGTIASTLQYKNALASFLTASIFLGLYLWSTAQGKIEKTLLAVGNFLLLLVLFSTQSHGGYMVFGFYTLILLCLNPVEKRIGIITGAIGLAFPAIIASKMFLSNIMLGTGLAWLWVLAGAIIIAIIQYVSESYNKREKVFTISNKQLVVGLLIAIIIGSASLGFLGVIQVALEKLHVFGAMERFTMYEDGLKMLMTKPILGWGGGGWSEAYTSFQGYGYNVRQTHSYFLQIAIETGFVGLTVVTSFWILFLSQALKIFRNSIGNINQAMVASILCAILAIISHAVIDFNLSLSALSMVMFTLMACLLSLGNNQGGKMKSFLGAELSPGLKLVIATVAVFAVMSVSLLMVSSTNLTSAGISAITKGDAKGAVTQIEKAISMYPLPAQNYSLASQLYAALGQPDKAKEHTEKAVKMARYNPDRHVELAFTYLRTGENERAVLAAKKTRELASLRVPYYEAYSQVLTSAATNELRAGKTEQARKYINETLAIPEDINYVLQNVHPDKKKLWIYAQPLEVTPKISLNMAIAHLLSGGLTEAENELTKAIQNPEIQADTLLWQALLAYAKGDVSKSEEILKSAGSKSAQLEKQFDDLAPVIPKKD